MIYLFLEYLGGLFMCYYIGIEDLVANALIESLKKLNKRILTYEEIENYGAQVIQILNENNEKAILILSRNNTTALFHNYSDLFEEIDINGQKGISLKSNVELNQLIKRFRGYLALNVLMAFINERSVSVLGV